MKKISACVAASLAMAGIAQAQSIEADVWADNWFAFYLNGELVAEDSVPITTERSFNAESFRFNAPQKPYVLGFIAKDFKENETGLEYIGSRRQQMGDGGFIAQFQSGGQTIAATGSGWKCLVVHEAPIDKMCERERNPVAGQGSCGFVVTQEPVGWKSVGFDDSAWPNATEHSARAVGPKDGYDRIRWVSDAKIIWGPDLETNNTVLCRLEVR